MKLNDKEKADLVNFIKKEYNRSKEMLDKKDLYYWLKDEKEREKHIAYIEKLKEKYETLEAQKEVDIELNLDFNKPNSNNNDFWVGIIGLIAVAAIFSSMSYNDLLDNIDPKNNKDLN